MLYCILYYTLYYYILLYYIILLYYTYTYIIIIYLILYSSLLLFLFLFPFLLSSLLFPSQSSDLSSFPSFLPNPQSIIYLPFIPNPKYPQSFPPPFSSFILYVSAFGSTYLYTPPSNNNLTPHVLSEWMVEVCRFDR